MRIAVIDSNIDFKSEIINLAMIEYNTLHSTNIACNDLQTTHGTIVCNVIQSIAPNVEIVFFPLSDKDDFYVLANMLEYIIETKCCNIINMSFGIFLSPNKQKKFEELCENLIANNIAIISASSEKHLTFPAIFKNVIAVGVSDEKNYQLEFGYYGDKAVDVVIKSVYNDIVKLDNGKCINLSTSSFATAKVSAQICQWLSSSEFTIANVIETLSINSRAKSNDITPNICPDYLSLRLVTCYLLVLRNHSASDYLHELYFCLDLLISYYGLRYWLTTTKQVFIIKNDYSQEPLWSNINYAKKTAEMSAFDIRTILCKEEHTVDYICLLLNHLVRAFEYHFDISSFKIIIDSETFNYYCQKLRL